MASENAARATERLDARVSTAVMCCSSDLRHTDEDMLQKFIRAAELFLGSQLTAGVAAGQRAVTFASVLAATAAVQIGVHVAAATSGHPQPCFGWVAIPVAVCLLVTTGMAILCCRPDWR